MAGIIRIMKAHTRYTDPIDCEAQHVHACTIPSSCVGIRRSHQDKEASRVGRRDSDAEDSGDGTPPGPPHNINIVTGTGSRTLSKTDCDSLIDTGTQAQHDSEPMLLTFTKGYRMVITYDGWTTY
jgi:hypothetical protein